MKRFMCLAIFLSLLSFVVYAQDFKLTDGQVKMIKDLQGQQYIKVEPEYNKVQVDPGLWRSMKADTKADFAATLAIYCTNHKKSNIYWVAIYDMYSGKKIAEFSKAWGMKIH